MNSVRMIEYSCMQNFHKWMKNPKIYVIVCLYICLFIDIFGPFHAYARSVDVKNTIWFLPFLVSDRFMGFFLLLGLILLFCDAPFIDRHQLYIVIRIGKKKWAIGQLLYIGLASFVFVMMVQVLIIIMMLPTISFSADWGPIFYTYAQIGIEGLRVDFGISYDIMYSYTPIAATLLSMFLLWLEGVFIGSVIFFGNLHKQMMGTLSGCFFVAMYLVMKSIDKNIGFLWKVIPTIWMELVSLSEHSVEKHPGVPYAVTVLIGISLLLGIGCIKRVKKQPIEVIRQM